MRKLVLTFIPHRYRDPARAAVFTILSVLYMGSRFECPVCSRTSRRWVSLGFPDLLCPHCSAFGRQRLMLLYLQNELDLAHRPLKILHFAPEACMVRYFDRLPNLTYIGGDLDPPRGAIRLDITEIELDSDSVDVVLCSHVLEHVPADAQAISEMRRVLRPGGTALIMGPVEYDRSETYEDPSIVSPRARAVAFNQSDHVRIYGADFDDRLRAAGFALDANRYAQSLSDQEINRYGLDREEIIYVCTNGADDPKGLDSGAEQDGVVRPDGA
jgi:SAM-dependent methyltransferase